MLVRVVSLERTRGRVLVLDRDPGFARGAAALLEREGYRAACVFPVARACRRARRLAPELVLLGPGFSGGMERNTLRRLRAATRTAGVPVIRIADASRPEAIAAGFAAGWDDCILRPFFPIELFGRMDRALDRYRAFCRLHGETGLPAGRAAVGLMEDAFRVEPGPGVNFAIIVLYLPECELLSRSDRAALWPLYGGLLRELPHRCAELVRPGRGPLVLCEPNAGVVVLAATHAPATDPPGTGLSKLSRLLNVSDRWLARRGATGTYLAAVNERLVRRPVPRFHALVVEGVPRDFDSFWNALAFDLKQDASGRAGGRLRRVRI